jgi:hypothetical protein
MEVRILDVLPSPEEQNKVEFLVVHVWFRSMDISNDLILAMSTPARLTLLSVAAGSSR